MNDFRLHSLSTGAYVVAFDVGRSERFLRRLGVVKPPSNVQLAGDVEMIDDLSLGIKLSNSTTMHPPAIADLLGDLDRCRKSNNRPIG